MWWPVLLDVFRTPGNSPAFSDLQNLAFPRDDGTTLALLPYGKSMLRISFDAMNGHTITLRLDGQLIGRWVRLLQRFCAIQMKKQVPVTLDLQNVSFADREGIALLRRLSEAGRVQIVNALPFIAEQIRSATHAVKRGRKKRKCQ
jgi:ABC-type transporter Mla MlaB component